jgi:hypothetical protein
VKQFIDSFIVRQLAPPENLRAEQLRFLVMERFFDEVYHAELHGLDHLDETAILTECYKRSLLAQNSNVWNQIGASDFLHVHIDERNVVVRSMTSGEGLRAIAGCVHGMAGRLKGHFQAAADMALVIGDQYANL